MMLRSSILAVVSILAISPTLHAELIVSPPEPLSTQNVSIALTRVYPSAASIDSASIVLEGDVFKIFQTVLLGCSLPTLSNLTSQFDVGPLAAGSYQIIAEIELVSPLPDCGGETIIETSSFSVGDPVVAIPTLNTLGLIVIAGILLCLGIGRLKASESPPLA